ncbi:MAG: serine/threonine protein kinase [Planctomycetes bacterium]|nr:serine/threonine protein kinase [Planctomycetota bacterium]
MAPDPAGEARTAFLQRYAADLERGSVQALAAYQALFPGFEREVAEEYACLEDEGAQTAPVAAPPAESGRRHLGKYLLERELGRGGQAVVYLAEDVALGRPVALKVLRAGTIEFVSPDDLRRFRREAEVSARLEHPAICSVYEAGEAEGVPYIAMRYVRGTTLAQHIAACRSSGLASRSAALPAGTPATDTTSSSRRGEFDALLRLFELCARALHFAHEHGLVHRDVKPGNVMVTEQGEPVLLDFGLARVEAEEHSLTASGVVFGTPYYMAPEQVRGEARAVDRRTDVYGLGVSLYETLTLQRPFEAPSREALYRQILLHEPRPVRAVNPRVPRDLQIVVETAMAKEPARRYQTALDLAEDLRRLRQREPIVARAAGPLLRGWRFAQRRPAVAVLLVALAASLATGAALLAASNRLLSAKVGEFTRLADLRHVGLLEQELDRLPAYLPAHEPALRRWLEDARRVHGRLPLHRLTRERLTADTGEDPVARQWQLDALAELIARLERFAGHRIALAERRLEHVRSVARRTLEDASVAWRAAIAAIADPVRAPRYRGLRIEP